MNFKIVDATFSLNAGKLMNILKLCNFMKILKCIERCIPIILKHNKSILMKKKKMSNKWRWVGTVLCVKRCIGALFLPIPYKIYVKTANIYHRHSFTRIKWRQMFMCVKLCRRWIPAVFTCIFYGITKNKAPAHLFQHKTAPTQRQTLGKIFHEVKFFIRMASMLFN